VVEFGELVACAVEAARQAVILDSRMSSFVGAHVHMFVGKVACSSTYTAPFIFRGLRAVLCVMVKQEASVTLSVQLDDSCRTDCNWCAKHGKTAGAVNLLDLFPSHIYENE